MSLDSEKEIAREVPEEEETYPLINIRGQYFPKPFLDVQNVEDVLDWKPDPTDIFIVTYPKCGTTWTQYLVWEIINKGAPPPSPNQMMFRDFPFLEITGIKNLDSLPRPRLMKTHLIFDLQPYNPSAKYIYIVRNPWDCCVSYYYHHKIDPAMPPIGFDRYFQLFITGEVGWGDFFDHVLSWYKHRNDPNFLLLTYEEMKRNTKNALFTIAKFLGDEHYAALQNDEKLVENCLKHSDFKYLQNMGIFFPKDEDPRKGNMEADVPSVKDVMSQLGEIDKTSVDLEKFQEVPFFRKGVIGDWRNHFSPEQIHAFNEYMFTKLSNTEMSKFWEPLMEETSF